MPTLQFTEGEGPPLPFSARKQLLNHIVDGIAQTRPESVWAKIPKNDSSYSEGYRKVTYRMMANAINGIAKWMTDTLGRSTTFETLAYFGPWDPRYIFILLGAVKAGYKMIFPSPTYGIDGLITLLDRVACRKILVSSQKLPIVSGMLKAGKHNVYEVPNLEVLLSDEFPHFPFDKTFATACSEPLVVVHTSGTTGPPKPVVWTHDWLASFVQQNQLLPPEDFVSLEHLTHGIELCSVAAPSHSSSLFPNLFGAVPNQIVVLFPVPDASLTLETTLRMIKHNDPSMLIAPPFVLSALASDPDSLELVASKVSMIGYGGGPLPQQAGDVLAKRFRLVGMYGTSEIGLVHKIAPKGPWDSQQWRSIVPHPLVGIGFRHHHQDCYEAVVVKNDHENEQPVFKIVPELSEWAIKDLFSPDPRREGSWIYQGRLDDVLILSNGGTVNPTDYEHRVASAPCVSFAVMCGTGKSCPALLVQLSPTTLAQQALAKEEVFTLVQKCNSAFPPQASVPSSHIIFTSDDRPLPISAKGAVQRAAALQLYQKDIDALYP